MGRHQPQVAASLLAQDEKLFVLIIEAGILFKTQNEISFIRDQYCHLADDGSAIFYFIGVLLFLPLKMGSTHFIFQLRHCSSVGRAAFKGPSLVQLYMGSNHAMTYGDKKNFLVKKILAKPSVGKQRKKREVSV